VIDARDGTRLAAHDETERLPIASTTKLMTAYLALRDLPLHRRLTAPVYRPIPGESLMGLEPGERDTVHDLLYGMLLPSGNDAAVTLAEGVAGSVPRFVAMMNATARRLGLSETHYATPVGLDSPGNYSTAHDLVKLAEILRRNPLFRKIVDTRRKTVRSGAEVRHLVNTNELLGTVPYVTGVKTGTTLDARHVLVSSASRHGVKLVAALLGAPSDETRDEGTRALLDYGFSRYLPQRPLVSGKPAGHVAVRYESRPLPLLAGRSVRVWARPDQPVRAHVEAPATVIGPIPAGARVGTATVSVDGRREATVALRTRRAIAAPVIAGGAGLALPGGFSDGLAAVVGVIAVALGAAGLKRSRTQ
jgi:D-alanyl-D-alanine carboxypeptidase (penicillin-binding protein 5/6)